RSGRLEVDQPGFVAREQVLVLQARHLHPWRDPAVALPVEAHEDIALRQVSPVELTRRVGTRTRLEEHGRETQLGDGPTQGGSLSSQFLERRTDKDAHPLVRRADRRKRGGRRDRSVACIQWIRYFHKRAFHSSSCRTTRILSYKPPFTKPF